MSHPTVSVILLTLDRADALRNTLESLREQTYPSFEVVVVVGPCTDHTVAALDAYAHELTIVHNPERNIAISRNIGVSASTGEILAFLDDDEIPSSTWLHDLVEGLTSDESLGAVGGVVYGPNGHDVDWLYCSADRYGTAYLSVEAPTHLEPIEAFDPARERFQYLPGGNNAVRRSAINAIGGFDEAITYYAEETELFLRMHLAGWGMRQLTNASVRHLMLAGVARDNTEQRTTNWLPVLRSRVHFARKHAVRLVGPERVITELSEWAPHVRNAIGPDNDYALLEFNAEFAKEMESIRQTDAGDDMPAPMQANPHFVIREATSAGRSSFGTCSTSSSPRPGVAKGSPSALERWSLARRVSEAVQVVVVRLIGGAGNELFQYAAALSITDIANVRTIANDSDQLLSAEVLLPGFIRPGSDLELELLGLRDPAITPETRLRKRAALRAVRPVQRFVARRTVDLHGAVATAFAPPPELPRPRMLDGYFQHPAWFKPGDQVVIAALLDNAPAGWAEFARTNQFNAVCFRRGDYEPLGWMLPAEYYDAAMPHLGRALPLAIVGDDRVFNEHMVAQYREGGHKVANLPQFSGNAAVNDFWVLAGAANVVMANSTFCWWATRVGDALRAALDGPRTVVCPRSWLAGVPHRMIEPDWTAIDDTLELLRHSGMAAQPTGRVAQ